MSEKTAIRASMSIPEDMDAAIKKAAGESGCSYSYLCRQALGAYLLAAGTQSRQPDMGARGRLNQKDPRTWQGLDTRRLRQELRLSNGKRYGDDSPIPSNFTDADVSAIERSYRHGATLAEIADAIDLTVPHTRAILEHLGALN